MMPRTTHFSIWMIIFILLSAGPVLGRIIHVKSELANGNGHGKGTGDALSPYLDLQYSIDQAVDGDTLLLSPGLYAAKPEPFTEDLCGNSEVHRTPVQASRGFLIENKALTIVGAGAETTTLITNAGYGVLFLNSRPSRIERLSITGGKRDPDGKATDAAIVAKFSTVSVCGIHIRDNTDYIDSTIVGIGGIIGRENSELFICGNTIANNSWDGIALYRGATATITDNIITQGRGAGIGITWDATAIVQRNEITEYWKGIGAFGASRAIVSNNLVKDCLGWGIIATGEAYLDAVNNNVMHIGNCGLAIWSDDCRGRFVNNIVVNNGWRDQWVAPQVGLQNYGNPANFIIACNDFWNNASGNYGDMEDLTGQNGNLAIDPAFVSETDFHLNADSPCRDAGSSTISEGDGSVSDIGMYGGPAAR